MNTDPILVILTAVYTVIFYALTIVAEALDVRFVAGFMWIATMSFGLLLHVMCSAARWETEP